MIVKQFFILIAMLFLGYLAAEGLGLPLPANVLALGFLLLALIVKLVKLEDVDKAGNFIIEYLAVFFIPPAVGVMTFFDLLASDFFKIILPLFTAILVGFFVAGQVTQLLIKITRGHHHA